MDVKFKNSFLVFPQDNNNLNTLFGGKLLAEMDLDTAILVRRLLSKTDCDGAVTVKVGEVVFEVPAHTGDLVTIICELIRLGRTSMDIRVIAEKEDFKGNSAQMCTAIFTFVAMKDGKPYPHYLTFDKIKDL